MDVLQVLDWIARGIGCVVLLGGMMFLTVLVWDLSTPVKVTLPGMEDGDLLIVTPLPDQREAYERMRAVHEQMGYVCRFDYANFGGGVKDRLGHCYMIAAKAMLWQEYPRLPSPAGLIHGSWHGPDAPQRTDHAIVLLDDGRIWEPITAGVYERDKFQMYTRWQRHQIYSAADAREKMLVTGTYGPWGN